MAMFSVGDRVKYSTKFCRSISAYAGDIPHARGEVTATKDLPTQGRQLVSVKWDKLDAGKVLNTNLQKA